MSYLDFMNLLNNHTNKDCFSMSQESIIKQFTSEENEKKDNINKYTIHQLSEQTTNLGNYPKGNINKGNIKNTQNVLLQEYEHIDTKETNTGNTEYSNVDLLKKIRNLENEKIYLLKFLEKKKNQELEYKKALETQVAKINSENKKSEFYEKEWLKMRSMEYFVINSGSTPFRQLLEERYNDPSLYEKFGNFTRTQEAFVTSLIKDHKNLVTEKKNLIKKYNEAVDCNFQLYQQNEMLKAQNTCLLNKNKDIINVELEKKMEALNSSLIYVQKENIEMREILDQYSKLIKNISDCSEIQEIKGELEKFRNHLHI